MILLSIVWSSLKQSICSPGKTRNHFKSSTGIASSQLKTQTPHNGQQLTKDAPRHSGATPKPRLDHTNVTEFMAAEHNPGAAQYAGWL